MKFAPHIGLSSPDDFMFPASAGKDPIDQIKFIADQGFSGIEDNFLKLRPIEVQEKIGKELARHNLEMGCFVNNLIFDRPTFVSDSPEAREVLLQQLQETIEVANRVNGKYVTTLSGILDPRLDRDYQTANMIKNLKYCAELAEKAGIVLGIEAITGKWWQGTFVTTIPHAYLIVKAVNSSAVKLIFDTFQAQMETGNIIAQIDRVWDEIALFQIADAPQRTEPTSGEMNYDRILKHIQAKGYDGLIEMEHSVSQPGKAGEQKVLDFYKNFA
ncbi:MAG: TIM barrel protein [Crocosphaera sp.]|nr:TIM barrel protein [Crocosphaera sp.]